MENKVEFKAAKSLLDFMQSFSELCEKQLSSIHGSLAEVVADIMNSVTLISNSSESWRQKADSILVRMENLSKSADTNFQQDVTQFIGASGKEVEAKEKKVIAVKDQLSPEGRQEILANQLRRAGGMFSKQMEAVSGLENDVKSVLVSIMGALSMDDVIAARLDHLVIALNAFNLGLSKILENYESSMSPIVIQEFRGVVLTQVYRSYTTEEEKEVFHKVFGVPKTRNKAS